MPYAIALAGSTSRTVQIAELIANDSRCSVAWVLSPTSQLVGRKHVPTDNPLHLWALERKIPCLRVNNKIDQILKNDIENTIYGSIDVLLVVDFGYLIPQWLLDLPTIAPLNLHPSVLPAWRGSAPAVGPLLTGDSISAMSLIVMNSQLDQGPIIHQAPFAVAPTWTQTEYYAHAFTATSDWLVDTMVKFAERKISANAQPARSPTPLARQLTKADSFLPWNFVSALCDQDPTASPNADQLSPLLAEIWTYLKIQQQHHQATPTNQLLTLPQYIERASRAFSPWPQLWSTIPTSKGEKRMKLLSLSVATHGNLQLETIQIEGQQPAHWNQVKTAIRQ